MTKQLDCNVILKYCEIVDEFIKVRVFTEDDIGDLLKVESVPNKKAYQNLVVTTCIVDYEEEVVPLFKKFSKVYKPEALAELLYQICIEVNPHLEIHQVSLPMSESEPTFGTVPFGQDPKTRQGKEFQSRVLNLEQELHQKIIGQPEAVESIAKAIKKAYVGLKDPRKPVGVFLLVGSTGTGKTELAKVLTRHLFDDLTKLVRVDCSEYALPHEYAKLIGAPPGYIGHNEGGFLSESVREKKSCVVLFDEIEKAHHKLHNLLLQVMDEGFLSDNKGTMVPFNKSIILLTSNVGVEEISSFRNRMGFDHNRRQSMSRDEATDAFREAMKGHFRPEFINRLDDVLVFNHLTTKDCVSIARLQLGEVAGFLDTAGIKLTHTQKVEQLIAQKGYSAEYGARELRRIIKSEIEDPLSEQIIDGRFEHGDHVEINVRRQKLAFEKAKQKGARRSPRKSNSPAAKSSSSKKA